jgi:phosphoribosylformimino-5-aminoimidazole carboxamide ribotide isomerase
MIPTAPSSSRGGLTLYPAIDIRDRRAVRLLRGDYDRETAYDADPRDAARRWLADGATILHVVDLDGARAGSPQNLDLIAAISELAEVPVQVGGGLRDTAAVAAVIEAGAARAVLGTRAQRDPEFVGGLVAELGAGRIVASVDGRGGRVAIEGWEEATDTPVPELVSRLAALGVERFVYTPVEVDGTLEGPGLDGLESVADACTEGGAELIYSGGVGTLDDLRALRRAGHPAIGGVIVGRALYEGRFSIAEAIEALGAAIESDPNASDSEEERR